MQTDLTSLGIMIEAGGYFGWWTDEPNILAYNEDGQSQVEVFPVASADQIEFNMADRMEVRDRIYGVQLCYGKISMDAK